MINIIDFCANYVTMFLNLISYSENNDIDLIEKNREECISNVESLRLSDDVKKELINGYNTSFDKQIFNFIKTDIADEDPEFFKTGIDKLRELLNNNQESAKRLQMVLPSNNSTIEDFYHNYLIAFKYCLNNLNEFDFEYVEEE